MPTPHSIAIDVSSNVPLAGHQEVAAWIFAPEGSDGPVPLLFCLPGGSYTKAYWHLEVPGRSGYSFAEYFAAKGMLVVAIDHLGTGDSSRISKAADLTPAVVAAANAAALDAVKARALTGELKAGLAPMTLGPVVGVGHSMGAMLAIFQQSLHESFDAIAPLGWGTIGPIITFGNEGIFGSDLPSYEAVLELATLGALDDMGPLQRTADMHHHFYWEDVPPDVIAADDLTVTPTPGITGLLSITPFIGSDHARRITCPVFVGLGDRDSTFDHYDEVRAYRGSRDITLYVLPQSGHCHNTASTRLMLWERIEHWVRTLMLRDREVDQAQLI